MGIKEIMEKPTKVLSSQLMCENRRLEVTFNHIYLTWKSIDTSGRLSSKSLNSITKTLNCNVPVSEIVAVREANDSPTNKDERRRSRKLKINQQETELYPYAFTVSYVERARQHRWRCRDITFHCSNETMAQLWVQTIHEHLSSLSSRPRSLLVYINPYGGKQRGQRIYERIVAPLFARASIFTDVIVTEGANHARDHLKIEASLQKYDGVVCVGGDGMFNEIVQGLVSRTQADSGGDQNQPEQNLVPCSLRIGIIPAGSTDCICYATVGTNDPVTSALHIIVGDSQPMDVCTVHHNKTFLRYSVSLLGYGFYGDVLTDSETKRWMGPARYDLSGFKTFLSHQYYEGTVSFLPADDHPGDPRDKLHCRSGCHVCQHQGQHLAEFKVCKVDGEKPQKDSSCMWRVIQGKFLAINAASMSCACPRSPQGLSPAAHLADGTTDLILVRKCSRFHFLRHLIRHTNKEDQFDHTFVEVHRVRRFRFEPKRRQVNSGEDLSGDGERMMSQGRSSAPACGHGSLQSSWTCDGEVLPHVAIQVSVHSQLIKLFARGIEEPARFEDSV